MSIILHQGDIRSHFLDHESASSLEVLGWRGAARSPFLSRRRPDGHTCFILTQRAQKAMFSGRTCGSQARCGGSQVYTSRYSHQACAETDAVLRYGASCSHVPTPGYDMSAITGPVGGAIGQARLAAE